MLDVAERLGEERPVAELPRPQVRDLARRQREALRGEVPSLAGLREDREAPVGRDERYVVEVKTAKNFKGEDSYKQLAGYLDKLDLPEGWMPIFDEDKSKTWEEKLYNRDVFIGGKALHIVGL